MRAVQSIVGDEHRGQVGPGKEHTHSHMRQGTIASQISCCCCCSCCRSMYGCKIQNRRQLTCCVNAAHRSNTQHTHRLHTHEGRCSADGVSLSLLCMVRFLTKIAHNTKHIRRQTRKRRAQRDRRVSLLHAKGPSKTGFNFEYRTAAAGSPPRRSSQITERIARILRTRPPLFQIRVSVCFS